MEPSFITIDLDLESERDLQPILDAFSPTAFVLHHARTGDLDFARLEMDGLEIEKDPDVALNKFCELVEALPADLREQWDQCSKRILDLGYDSGDERPERGCHWTLIQSETIARLARNGFALGFSLYPVPPEDEFIPPE
ncbi:MAG: hypothetical protein O7G85_12950 [Planctomycetota bacterium]|nr:hypothetical protein [Planctomycetota bacterium]